MTKSGDAHQNRKTEPLRFRPSRSKGIDRFRLGCLPYITDKKRDSICFIHNHKIVRASKVYINVYHLWKKWLNRAMRTMGMGGGYHASIEVAEKEYHFGGCSKIDEGIFETRPLHASKHASNGSRRDGAKSHELDGTTMEMVGRMGSLKERRVVGLWSGSEADFDLLLRHLKDEGQWKGINYRLLTFNCNYFVKAACELLINHSKHFHPIKGMKTADQMVPLYLFRLTGIMTSRCFACITGDIEEQQVEITTASSEEEFVFTGKAKFLDQQRDIHSNTSVEEQPSGYSRIKTRKHISIEELRKLRIRALGNQESDKESRNSKQETEISPSLDCSHSDCPTPLSSQDMSGKQAGVEWTTTSESTSILSTTSIQQDDDFWGRVSSTQPALQSETATACTTQNSMPLPQSTEAPDTVNTRMMDVRNRRPATGHNVSLCRTYRRRMAEVRSPRLASSFRRVAHVATASRRKLRTKNESEETAFSTLDFDSDIGYASDSCGSSKALMHGSPSVFYVETASGRKSLNKDKRH